jgi:hypothetical protein
MATDIVAELKAHLSDSEYVRQHAFALIRQISTLVNAADEDGGIAQELILRSLEKRRDFGQYAEVLDGLVRQVGLFPYLEPDNLSLPDLLAYEFHRPLNLDERTVFHQAQAVVYRRLLDGESVILSAPTSFGKSLIIDAMIASGRFRNVVVVVPTIALIDETRRRLFERFKADYKIITHAGQQSAERNVYVLTQERVVDFPDLGKVDFFVIDEFYKLDTLADQQRSALLNEAFYKLWSGGVQFYLLGPNIEAIPAEFEGQFRCRFIKTDYATVISEFKRIPADGKERRLIELCEELRGDATLIYCSTPTSTRRVAATLHSAGIGENKPQLADAVQWLAEEIHPDWTFSKYLQRGIGIHHGKLPRALAQFVVRSFNEGHLNYLVCTSTLIEGVNTKARNVIIYDNTIGFDRELDYFTFNNIKGRSGRMFKHFIGRVFAFEDPPEAKLPAVDIPLFTQAEGAPESLLIQLNERDLSQRSRERLRPLREQDDVSFEVLKANRGVEPQSQMAVASELRQRYEEYHKLLNWRRRPKYKQLLAVCELIWKHYFSGEERRAINGISSGRQLAYKIDQLRKKGLVSFIKTEAESASPDKAIDNVFDFQRTWAGHNFPQYLMVLSRIQEEVFTNLGLEAGDYSFFAREVENCFSPPGLAALEEYGIPLQISLKMSSQLPPEDDTSLDSVLSWFRKVNVVDCHKRASAKLCTFGVRLSVATHFVLEVRRHDGKQTRTPYGFKAHGTPGLGHQISLPSAQR